MKIVMDSQLWVVTDWQLRTPGNLRSFVVIKARNLQDGRTIEKTFRGGTDNPEQADVETKTCQYLYKDGSDFTFMELTNYEQFAIPEELLGAQAKFLLPDQELAVQFWNDRPIGVELPLKMVFTITDTMDFVTKGNSSGNITKDATLENGIVVQVPAFIKNGEKVRVNTETGEYIERA
jgi:elongation factor P